MQSLSTRTTTASGQDLEQKNLRSEVGRTKPISSRSRKRQHSTISVGCDIVELTWQHHTRTLSYPFTMHHPSSISILSIACGAALRYLFHRADGPAWTTGPLTKILRIPALHMRLIQSKPTGPCLLDRMKLKKRMEGDYRLSTNDGFISIVKETLTNERGALRRYLYFHAPSNR